MRAIDRVGVAGKDGVSEEISQVIERALSDHSEEFVWRDDSSNHALNLPEQLVVLEIEENESQADKLTDIAIIETGFRRLLCSNLHE